MAIRSIKLKLRIKDVSQKSIIWNTHDVFNQGVAYYLKWLLMLRQELVIGCEFTGSSDELLKKARDAQARNIKKHTGSDDDILNLLRSLYNEIVPSHEEGKSGDAQSLARCFQSPLVDPKSEGGLGTSKSGRKPRWQVLKDTNDPTWKDVKAKYEEKKEGKSDIISKLKKDFGLLPLFKSFTDSIGMLKNDVCTTWDRDMFQQAIERLMSWESWNIRVKKERKYLEDQIASIYQKHFDPEPDWFISLKKYEKERKEDLDGNTLPSDHDYRLLRRSIRGWDRLCERWQNSSDKTPDALWLIASELQTELKGGFGDPTFFRWLTKSENHFIWDRDKDVINLFVSFNGLQDKFERSKTHADFTIPDPVFHPLWVRYGGQESQTHKYRITPCGKDAKFEISIKTLAKQGNTIIENQLECLLADSKQFSTVEVLTYKDVPDSIYSQYKSQKNDKKAQWVKWSDPGSGHKFYGKTGGAKLQFDRPTLEKNSKKPACLTAGSFGSAFINITMDLIPIVQDFSQVDKAFKKYKPKEENSPRMVSNFNEDQLSTFVQTQADFGINGLESGLRVMTVDLGLRSFAACSIFELSNEKPNKKGLIFPVADTSSPVWAIHQRSFLLRLSGEETDKNIDEKRKQVSSERLELRSAIRRQSNLLSLTGKGNDERQESLNHLLQEIQWKREAGLKQTDDITGFMDNLKQLESIVLSNDEDWYKTVIELHRKWEQNIGVAFSEWRAKYRRRTKENQNLGGLSFWWINELTETRRLINSWSAHARTPGEIVRARETFGQRKDEQAREVDLDKRLLNHLNNMKEDRLKKGADLLVMSALGYVYDEENKKWIAKYPPCRLVLFEDLSRYRFRTDRPKNENSMLMKWGHRAIPKEVAMQGDLFGIRVGTVGAGFTSRFHAATGSPGVRVRVVKEDDLNQSWFINSCLSDWARRKKISQNLYKELMESSEQAKSEFISRKIKPGSHIAWAGGELFATLSKAKKPIIVHADINAAQNLQRRFWTRYADPERLPCIKMEVQGHDDDVFYIPEKIGKRLEYAMGYGRLVPTDYENSYKWEKLTQKQWQKQCGHHQDNIEDDEKDNDDMGEIEEIGNLTGERLTFFRDPSGVFFNKDHWIPSDKFWGTVHSTISQALSLISPFDDDSDVPL